MTRVGMLGCGTVGGAVLRLLDAHRAEIERRAGGPVEIVRVAVRDAGRDRGIDPALLDRKSTRLNFSHVSEPRMPSSA